MLPSGDSESEDDDNPLSFKNDDIAKMHAYRDALPHVRSARVLYPGNDVCHFPALEDGAFINRDGVGAIPLVPGTPPDHLLEVLLQLLQD